MSTASPATPALACRRTRFESGVNCLGAALHTVSNHRARRVMLFLAAVWLLNAFDLTMTIRAQADGVLHEGNPVARFILQHGAPALTAFKFALLAGATIVLASYRRLRCVEMATCLVALIYVGVAFQWKLCYDMYEIAHAGAPSLEAIEQADAKLRYIPVL